MRKIKRCFQFVVQSEGKQHKRTHMSVRDWRMNGAGVLLQVFHLKFFKLDTCYWIERFLVTSRWLYWGPKTKKRRPYWCTKPVVWGSNSILIQKSSFVWVNQYGGLSRGRKRSRPMWSRVRYVTDRRGRPIRIENFVIDTIILTKIFSMYQNIFVHFQSNQLCKYNCMTPQCSDKSRLHHSCGS